MKQDHNMPIKIRRLAIRNYKGIDEFEMDFPIPKMPGDPDILVMGSRNGLGKTSIIECCSLLLLALTLDEDRFKFHHGRGTIDIPDLLIKAGSGHAEIEGDIVIDDEPISFEIRLDRHGNIKKSGDMLHKTKFVDRLFNPERDADELIAAICGFSPNPVIENTFLLFHSYRKVQEGNPELGMMVDRGRSLRYRTSRNEFPMSAFKLRILRSLMRQANLFELVDDREPDETIGKLNELVQFYAGGTISKLRPSPDNTVDFRVNPEKGGESFTFDGLSSGQKEIISTLFLIWYHTKNRPSVVFIDEPELHLNAQWHRSFINRLMGLAPQNQYIIATHSEDVMDSVSEDRRVLLLDNDEGAK